MATSPVPLTLSELSRRSTLAVGRPARVHVRLDVAAGHLNIANVPFAADDLALRVVADVAGGHVDLMQIDVVEKKPDASVLIKVAIGDEHVAIPPDEVNAVASSPNQETREN